MAKERVRGEKGRTFLQEVEANILAGKPTFKPRKTTEVKEKEIVKFLSGDKKDKEK